MHAAPVSFRYYAQRCQPRAVPGIRARQGRRNPWQNVAVLEIRNLYKAYVTGTEQRSVLGGLDLRIDSGGFAVLIGRSGSGKSTLLNLIAGIDRVGGGSIVIDGTDISTLAEPEITRFRRSRIGFVFQSFNLIPTLTVAENLALPLQLNGMRVDTDRIEGLLARISLPGRLHAYPEQLSGGEQQRVAIARAIVHQPALVLADEPTGNLDTMTARQVISLLTETVAEHGATLLMATHSPEIIDTPYTALRLEDGRIDG
ncbi:MAG: ABC transporter ATP-binding protein [Gammaproteobacteria bacterium]|nr:ABC transporter ATP-binding protein [Gammaproteobacteria bacterium]